MNEARLLAHYERIADAPDAVERLRRFILDLAVRGRLVPQDPREDPASDLLKRIAKEKVRLVSAGKVGKATPLLPISKEEQPFDLPNGWAWTRLDALCGLITKGSSPKWQGVNYVSVDEGILFITSENVGNYELRKLDDLKYVETRFRDIEPRSMLKRGDILMNLVGASIGRTAIYALEADANINQAVALIRLIELSGCTSIEYLMHFFNSPSAVDFMLGSRVTTAQPNMSLTDVREFPVPFPPLAEQHRIVAKVDELMTLCDRLVGSRAEREATRDRLAASSLAHLNAPDSETFRDDARFALNALPALTARPDQIEQLRRTILNLALRGKLVPQNPRDKPAAELLKRIREWQLQGIARKEIRAPRKPLKPIGLDESSYLRPDGWEWARLGDVIYIQSGDGLTAANMACGEIPVFGGNGINGYHDKSNVNQPTIVIGRVGYYCGSIHVTPRKAWITDNAFFTHFCQDAIDLRFLVLLLNGTNLKQQENATAQPVISGSKIYPIVIGLPPLAEQHRVVAKVDELMALCDQLKVSLTDSATIRRRLLDVLLSEALAPVAAREVEAVA